MEQTDLSASPLAGLLTLDGYQKQRSNLFPGIESLRWYLRSNRHALISEGALLYVAGRLWVRPESFDRCVLAVGERAAARGRVVA